MVGASEIESKLGELRAKLKEYEGFARQIPQLKKEIDDLESDLEASAFHNNDGSGSPKRALPEAPLPPMAEPAQALEGEDKQKRMRTINKKLQQIQKLKEQGGELDADMVAKVRGEPKLLKELQCLKNGDVYESDGEEPPANFAALPSDPAEIEKRTKAINKKLEQIAALKAKKGGNVDPDAKAKIDSEHQLKQELAALQRGDTKVLFAEPSLDEVLEKQTVAKHELERRHKAIKKKLTAIDALKKQDTGSLDADAAAKLAAEKDLKKELGTVEKQMGEINKQERTRVEARLS